MEKQWYIHLAFPIFFLILTISEGVYLKIKFSRNNESVPKGKVYLFVLETFLLISWIAFYFV
jgi:hypothetical protein